MENLLENKLSMYVFSELVIKEANPMTAALAPFGLHIDDLAAADFAGITYFNVLKSPQEQIKLRSKIFEELKTLIAANDAFLRDKVDKVMAIYEATNSSLYRGYLGARKIDATGRKSSPDYFGTVAAAAITLVAEIPYLAGRRFDIENTGVVNLLFALSTESAEVTGTPVYVPAGSSMLRQSRNLNLAEAAVYLLIQNPDPYVSGSYKIGVME